MNVLLASTLVLDPFKFSGGWYEVAAHKVGFTPLSADTCLDTRSLFEWNPDTDEFDVQTQCRHLDRSVGGIKSVMRCPPLKDGNVGATCAVRYPNAPYVQPSRFKVLATDYESYALVEGAEDKSFVQIFSRFARPGNRFIEAKAELLKAWGYEPEWLHLTPVSIDSDQSSK